MTESTIFDHGYAVVIGVDKNEIDRLALPTVANDVTAIYEVLIHPERCAYNPENVKLLKGEESTKDNIIKALYWLQDKVKADPEATAVFYYSGHGMEDRDAEKYFLIPYDIKELANIRRYAIAAETFSEEVAQIQGERTLIMLDCCHAAGMKAKAVDLTAVEDKVKSVAFPLDTLPKAQDIPVYKGAPGATSKAVSDLLEGEGRAILNSSTGSQSSWVPAGGDISIFTLHLIEALTGHAPHHDEDTTVLVTDVMSWVTRNVEKTAEKNGVEQTPVMRTSGVFPIAQLIGGKGVALSKGAIPPDPLKPLPPTGNTTTYNQEGQTVEGDQYNMGNIVGDVGHIGPQNKYDIGGDYVGGDKVSGDKVGGDKVSGDKFEGITVLGNHGSDVSTGSGSQANVINNIPRPKNDSNLNDAFAPLEQKVSQEAPALAPKVSGLKTLVSHGSDADDNVLETLVYDLGNGLTALKPLLVELFENPEVAKAAGPSTRKTLKRM